MTGQTERKRAFEWIANIALAVGGVLLALLLLQGLIMLFPRLLPRFLRPNPYDQRQIRSDDIEITVTVGNGDLFIAQQGSIAPPENPDEVLAHHFISFGEDGFRRPVIEAASYPIIAIGDSFTEGGQAPMGWSDVVADELGVPVRNLGFQGYGPADYAKVMSEYGTGEPHTWVVIGFFEGNDLSETIVDETHVFSLPEITRKAMLAAGGSYTIPEFGEGPWKYPIEMKLGNRSAPLAFFEFHLWWQNAELETFENSRDMAVLGEDLASIQDDAGDACVLLAYFPDKSHVYFSHIADPVDQVHLASDAWQLKLDETNRLHAVESPAMVEQLLGRLDNQSIAVGNLAEQLGIHFVNVTPALQKAADRGQETYFPYDTHWNPKGHEVAGRAVADYIKEHPECQE